MRRYGVGVGGWRRLDLMRRHVPFSMHVEFRGRGVGFSIRRWWS